MDKEIWKDIKGFEGLYQVSNLGNVKHLEWKKPIGRHEGKYVIMPERMVKKVEHIENNYKWLTVLLSKRIYHKANTKQHYTKRIIKLRTLHSLVAEYFIEEKPSNDKVKILHIDGNYKNNRADNLTYVDHYQRITIRKDL